MFQVTREIRFCYGHRLLNYDGKCRHLHGHNGRAIITLETDRLDSQRLASDGERSNAEDVDMVHAISDFQNKQSGYDAALKSYAMVQRLSLFQYVNGG